MNPSSPDAWRHQADFNRTPPDRRSRGPAADKDLPKLRYAELLIASKFVLCPRGNGASSIRLFESMQLGICP
jgi:hypothetical protein